MVALLVISALAAVVCSLVIPGGDWLLGVSVALIAGAFLIERSRGHREA